MERMEELIRRIKRDFFIPISKHFPNAYGHVEEVDAERVSVYLYLPSEEPGMCAEFVKRVEWLLSAQEMSVFVSHKSHGITLNKEGFYNFWVTRCEPLYFI